MTALYICALFGACFMNIVNLIDLQNVPKERWPDFKSFIYWLPFIAWPLLGLALVYVYIQSDITLTPLLALNIGASAPFIIKSMGQANPFSKRTIDPGEGA